MELQSMLQPIIDKLRTTQQGMQQVPTNLHGSRPGTYSILEMLRDSEPKTSEEMAINMSPMRGMAKIWEEGGQQFVGPLYHGTYSHFLPDILRQGLQEPWEGRGVYMSRNPDASAGYAKGMVEADRQGAKPVLIKIPKLPVDNMRSDPYYDPDFRSAMETNGLPPEEIFGALRHMGNIPPDQFEVIRGRRGVPFDRQVDNEMQGFRDLIELMRGGDDVPWWAK